MCAQRNYLLSRLHASQKNGFLFNQPKHLDHMERNRGSLMIESPDTWAVAAVGDRSNGNFLWIGRVFLGDLNGHCSSKRRICAAGTKNISGFEGACLWVRRIRQLSQPGRNARSFSIQDCMCFRAESWSKRLRKVDCSFAGAGVSQFDDSLSSGHDLARLSQCLNNGAVGVGKKERVISLISCNFLLCLCGGELCLGRIGRCLDLVVS